MAAMRRNYISTMDDEAYLFYNLPLFLKMYTQEYTLTPPSLFYLSKTRDLRAFHFFSTESDESSSVSIELQS